MVNLDVFKANYSSSVGEEVSRESVTLTEQEASTIIDGLKNPHMKLKTLYIYCCKGNTYYTSVRDLLCDTSSIESIRSSNHPLLCRAGGAPATSSAGPAIFGRNALGFLSKMDSIAAWRTSSWLALLKQLLQLHPSQYNPEEKHSQYLRIARKENGESAMESIKMQHTKKKIILFVLF